jgi:hypothetical protein
MWRQAAIAWGDPVLDSAITTIADGRLYYRGRDAERLAQDRDPGRRWRGCCGVVTAWR